MNANDLQIIEINGVKLEVDLRSARKIDHLRLGSRVKVLVKVYSEYKVYPGIVVGFDAFQNLPTINVAYVDVDYSGVHMKFAAINANAKDVEIVAAVDADHLELSRDEVLAKFDRAIETEENKLSELRETRAFFLRKFGEYFRPEVAAA